jgi:hypothetical protein
MLDIDNIETAILYFYKDLSNVQVGNPQPFVASYDKVSQIDFNTLMFDGGVKNIFYGNITYSMNSDDAVATSPRLAISSFKTLDGVSVVVSMDIHKFFDATPLLANFAQGTTQGIFAQQIVINDNVNIAFDGYILAITNKP